MRRRRAIPSVGLMNCLALTGTDATLPFAIGLVLLLVGGAAVAIVAWRRHRRAGAALLLAIMLVLGGAAAIGVPQPALAASTACSDPAPASAPGAPSSPADPSDPSTPCTPATAVPDVAATARDTWQTGSVAGQEYLPLTTASVSAWSGAITAIDAIDPGTHQVSDTLTGSDGTDTESVATAAVDLQPAQTPTDSLAVSAADFGDATQGLTQPTVTVTQTIGYTDGCGGTLTTVLTVTGATPAVTPPRPPVCTPATAVPDISVGSTALVWNHAHDPVITELDLSAADQTTYTDGVAAITAIATPTKGAATFHYGSVSGPNGMNYNPGVGGFVTNTSEYDAVVGNGSGGTLTATFDFSYADGCGGTLVTHVTATGSVPEVVG